MKVDKDDLVKLHEIKANKIDTDGIQDSIGTLKQQIQHLVVMLNESIKLNLERGNDPTNAKENRVLNLLKQMQSLN